MKNFTKIVNLGKVKIDNRRYQSFIKIEFKDNNLSISGVEGPTKNGNCTGSCGQIVMSGFKGYESKLDLNTLEKVWNSYHLNDMQAGCDHQRELKFNHNDVNKPCPVCGYKYGTQWLRIDVPVWALEFLKSLPETIIIPAWI